MSARVLVVFHSEEGQTARIAARIADVLRSTGVVVDVREVEDAPVPDGYDGVVVGDPIHAAQHSRPLVRYVHDHADVLNAKPSAFFQVSLTSVNPDDEHTAAAQAIVRRFLDDTEFEPDVVGVFAGALAYSQYGWFKRRVMRWIVKREGGDTDASRDYEYTDWDAVDRFARDMGRRVTTGS